MSNFCHHYRCASVTTQISLDYCTLTLYTLFCLLAPTLPINIPSLDTFTDHMHSELNEFSPFYTKFGLSTKKDVIVYRFTGLAMPTVYTAVSM
jgi:hypothetical protein